MDNAVWVVLIVGVVAVVLIAILGRKLGWFSFSAVGTKIEARRAEEPGGASIRDARAGGDAEAIDRSGQRASVERVEAEGSIRAEVGTGDQPPKP